jgi:hypothetical protein
MLSILSYKNISIIFAFLIIIFGGFTYYSIISIQPIDEEEPLGARIIFPGMGLCRCSGPEHCYTEAFAWYIHDDDFIKTHPEQKFLKSRTYCYE